MKSVLRGMVFLTLLAFDLRAQESTFPECAVGVIVDKDETIFGSGFVAFSKRNVVTCAHVLKAAGDKVYFHAFMSDVLIPLTVQAFNNNSDLVVLKAEKDICDQQLKVNANYPSCISDTISYVGVSLKNSNDSIATMELNMSVLELTGQYRGDFGKNEFIEFPGGGEPGFSGSPVFNKRGEVIAVVSQAFYIRGIKSKTEELFNRAVLFPKSP